MYERVAIIGAGCTPSGAAGFGIACREMILKAALGPGASGPGQAFAPNPALAHTLAFHPPLRRAKQTAGTLAVLGGLLAR